MARALPRGVQTHPIQGTANRQILIGGLASLLGVAAVASIGSVGVVLLVLGALLIVSGAFTRSSGRAAQIVNKAFALSLTGDLEGSAVLLDHADQTVKFGYIRRIIDLQRALIAMRQGDIPRALVHAKAAYERPSWWLMRDFDETQRMEAQGLSALLHASSGESDKARAAIDHVRTNPYAGPAAMARAELAEGILLERAGDRGALRDHLTRERLLLHEHTHPRERAIVRAYQRLLASTTSTVYRKAAPREPQETTKGEPSLADWIAKLAPAAAPFLRPPSSRDRATPMVRRNEADDGSAPVDALALEAARKRVASHAPKRAGKVLLLWLLLLCMFIVTWQLLSPQPGADAQPLPPVEEAWSPLFDVLHTAVALALSGGIVAAVVLHNRRLSKRLRAAVRALGRRDDIEALQTLQALSAKRPPMIAAQAALLLAAHAERHGDLPTALAHCDKGLSWCAMAGEMSADLLRPGLLAERAFVLVGLDRSVEARAELGVLAQTSPSFPFLPKARLAVELLDALRRGDVASAAEQARASADAPLGPREELLADLARVMAQPDDAAVGEVELLQKELRDDTDARRWLLAVAPTVLSTFHSAVSAPRDENADSARNQEAFAEAESIAEAQQEEALDAQGIFLKGI